MVAIFTPRKELQQVRYEDSQSDRLPAAQFKGAVLYEGDLRVRIDPATRAITMEPATPWGDMEITENSFFAVEPLAGPIGAAIAGLWQLRTVVAGEERNVDPLDSPRELLHTNENAQSSDPIVPNRLRGVRDQTVAVRLSDSIQLNTNNHRARGTLGIQIAGASDSLRQLTFAGTVSGTWILGAPVVGGTSGAVGVVVALSPGISQGGSGNWVIVDMGVDYAGAEWATPEVVTSTTGSASGTLRADALGARSISPLTRTRSDNPATISGLGTKLFATSGALDFVFNGTGIKFPNPFVTLQNGIYIGDSVMFDDPPIADQIFLVVDTVPGPGDPSNFRNVIITDPPHGQADGPTSQAPITILYDPSKQETLLATAVEFDATSPGIVEITAADGRTWTGIGLALGDNWRTKNSANGNNFDLRLANLFTQTNPNDRAFLPGDSHLPFAGPYPETFDVYKLAK